MTYLTDCDPMDERDPRCKCFPVHGNADDDGICPVCRPRVEAAQERREEALGAALNAMRDQILTLPLDTCAGVLDALADAFVRLHGDAPESCALCGWTDGCQPGCAVEQIRELVD